MRYPLRTRVLVALAVLSWIFVGVAIVYPLADLLALPVSLACSMIGILSVLASIRRMRCRPDPERIALLERELGLEPSNLKEEKTCAIH